MALRHRRFPHWGVQFHPESIETEWGERLIRNFVAASTRAPARPPVRRRAPVGQHATAGRADRGAPRPPGAAARRQPDAARARGAHGVAPGRRRDRLRRPVRVRAERVLARQRADRTAAARASRSWAPAAARSRRSCPTTSPRASSCSRGLAARERVRTGLLDWLERALAEHRIAQHALPFEFAGGWVGYLGYELKAECGARARAPLAAARRAAAVRRPAHRLRPPDRRGARGVPRARRRGARRRARLARANGPPPADAARPGGAGARAPARRTTTFALARPPAALPGRHRRVPGAPGRRRELRDLPHQRAARPALPPTRSPSTASCAASIRRRSPRSCGSATSR